MSGLQPKVALGDGFLEAYSKIPRAQQKGVMNFVSKFRANPRGAGINYEVIRTARDSNLRSVRIDQNYRGIVLSPEQGNVYVLLWVDKHDDAYKWAGRHRCSINPKTGTLQLYETTVEIDDSVLVEIPVEAAEAAPAEQPAQEAAAPQPDP